MFFYFIIFLCRSLRTDESGSAKIWEIFMDSCGGAHGEAPILCSQGNPTASESAGDLSGAEEAHTSRGGEVPSSLRGNKNTAAFVRSNDEFIHFLRCRVCAAVRTPWPYWTTWRRNTMSSSSSCMTYRLRSCNVKSCFSLHS